MFVNPKNQDLCFDNIAQNVGTEIKIRHLHKGISSSEFGLRWSQTRSDSRHIEEENTNPIHNMEYHKLTIKE